MPDRTDYQIIVIGGGHAGAEAAWAAANMLRAEYDEPAGERGRVALVTMKPDQIGAMSCNPAIGGLAKGQIVREIDAMGGLMGLAADATGIQFRVLNASKGAAVRGPRCQSDKYAYAREVQRLLATRPNLDIIPGMVDDLVVTGGRCQGVVVRTIAGEQLRLAAGAVVLTTGTFMRGLMHTGETQTQGGRVGEAPSLGLSESLQRLGLELGRLKTGTPPRLAAETIDFASLELQPGDDQPRPFSEMSGVAARDSGAGVAPAGAPLDPAYDRVGARFPVIEQRPCWITHTCAAAHEQIRSNLDRAPLFNGQIEKGSVGPRYCPSIEDKVMRFADRDSHHVFLEPESLETNEIYCNGISTSLPRDVQDFIVRHLPGCENAKILRYGYAVEYDMVWPHQIDATGMTKAIRGLLLAGQINGTSGYEEAAAQGLVAAVNAVRLTRGEELLRLRRDQAYIGVLMDDLVTKTPREPYRMFTSRAEHRLLLRADNADARLTPLARELGLVDDARWARFEQKQQAIAAVRGYMQAKRLEPIARRPGCSPDELRDHFDGEPVHPLSREDVVLGTVLADVQYAGYIEKQHREVERLAQQESEPLPSGFDYAQVTGLRNEAAHTLTHFQPATIGQARRLAGVTPADLMVVSLALRK